MFFVHFLGIFWLFVLYLMNMYEDRCLWTAVKFQKECKKEPSNFLKSNYVLTKFTI